MQIGEWPTSIAYAKSVGSGLLMTEVTRVRRYVINFILNHVKQIPLTIVHNRVYS